MAPANYRHRKVLTNPKERGLRHEDFVRLPFYGRGLYSRPPDLFDSRQTLKGVECPPLQH